MTESFETVLLDVGSDHVATITLNRPAAMNSFNQQMVDDFAEVWDRLRDDDSVHAIVLRAAGDRAFSTGIDVKNRLAHDPNVWNVRDVGEKALQIGLASEIVPREELWARAHELAALIASQPTVAVQGSVRAIWQSLDMTRTQALATGTSFIQIGNPIGEKQVDRANFARPKWRPR